VAGLAAAFGSGAMTNSINEFQDAELFLVTGSDTTEQHPLIGSRIIEAVTQKGAKLIVVDPRKIKLTKFATIHAQQKCGTDVAWINGMMNVIIAENLYKHEYVAERTENFEDLKKLVQDYTPEYVETITGIKADVIRNMARLYATTEKAMIVYAMGITQHITGVDNVKSLANLAMLTGHLGFPSCGVNPLRGQNNVQGACDMGGLPNVFSGYQKVSDEAPRKKMEAKWGVQGLPDKPGFTITDMMKKIEEGVVQCLYIMGENPLLSDPDLKHVEKELAHLPLLIVQDIFLTETAEHAHVVLPACSFAEKDGTVSNTERRVQLMHKAIEPIGNSKPDWVILQEIAQRLGYAMKYNSPKEIMEEIAEVTPSYAGIRFHRLEKDWGLSWPCPTLEHPGTQYLHKVKFTKGLGTFFPRPYIAPNELPDEEYNFLLTTGRVYFHYHTGTMTRKIDVLEREVPQCYVEMNPEDAASMKLRSGMKVNVASRRGAIEIPVLVTDKVPAKVVFLPFHFKEAAANLLTNPACDPVAGIPEYKVCAVKIRRA